MYFLRKGRRGGDEKENEIFFEEFIDEINNNNDLSPEQLSSLAYALGSFIKPYKYFKFIL